VLLKITSVQNKLLELMPSQFYLLIESHIWPDEYVLYGETLLEQENGASYLSPYTFSAKEKDTETGYSYFGARYYSAELSVWLGAESPVRLSRFGMDPMADKYPSLSAYNCRDVLGTS
jgi:RHS repeat-associated protein